MGEMIHVEVSSNKRTLSLELTPRQAKDLIDDLTNETGIPSQGSGLSLMTALHMIKDSR